MKSTYDLRYMDPFSILVIGQKGHLYRLYCPFYVLSRWTHDGFHQNQRVAVEMIRTIPGDTLGYVINGHVYPHTLFQIPLN